MFANMRENLEKELGRKNVESDERYKRARKWVNFVCGSWGDCVNRVVDCRFAQNYYNKAFQIYRNENIVFAMEENGEVSKSDDFSDYHANVGRVMLALSKGDQSVLNYYTPMIQR
jgi:hypothetical protein